MQAGNGEPLADNFGKIAGQSILNIVGQSL
jgi:hypothetical protein